MKILTLLVVLAAATDDQAVGYKGVAWGVVHDELQAKLGKGEPLSKGAEVWGGDSGFGAAINACFYDFVGLGKTELGWVRPDANYVGFSPIPAGFVPFRVNDELGYLLASDVFAGVRINSREDANAAVLTKLDATYGKGKVKEVPTKYSPLQCRVWKNTKAAVIQTCGWALSTPIAKALCPDAGKKSCDACATIIFDPKIAQAFKSGVRAEVEKERQAAEAAKAKRNQAAADKF